MNRTTAPNAETLRSIALRLTDHARECVDYQCWTQDREVSELVIQLLEVAADPLNSDPLHYVDESGQISNLYGEILMHATRAAQERAGR